MLEFRDFVEFTLVVAFAMVAFVLGLVFAALILGVFQLF